MRKFLSVKIQYIMVNKIDTLIVIVHCAVVDAFTLAG